MRQLLIGDCHFGTHSNSVIWLENQLNFFNTQFVDALNNENIDEVIFLGDLFDIRFSINQQVGIEVKKMLKRIFLQFPKINFIFIAGNHDFYSPLEEFHDYNVYDLIFGDEFVECIPNVKFIVYEPYFNNGDLYLPWYSTDNFDNFSNAIMKYHGHINKIFCHADVYNWSYSQLSLIENIHVWAGHIHYIQDKPYLHNIGAMFPMDFGDVNGSRYMYILDNGKLVDKIENNTTPKFKRYRNEEIFDLTEDDFINIFAEIVIYSSNANKAKYIERIKEIKTVYANYNPRIQIIDDAMGETLELSYFNANIDTYIDQNVPMYLHDKYELIKNKLKNNKEDE